MKTMNGILLATGKLMERQSGSQNPQP